MNTATIEAIISRIREREITAILALLDRPGEKYQDAAKAKIDKLEARLAEIEAMT